MTPPPFASLTPKYILHTECITVHVGIVLFVICTKLVMCWRLVYDLGVRVCNSLYWNKGNNKKLEFSERVF